MNDTAFLPCWNPATGEQFDQVAMSTPEEVQQARQELRTAFKVWGQKPVQERVRVLTKFQEVMIDAADEITAVLCQDCGKPRQDAMAEIFVTVDMLHNYLKHAARWLRRQKIPSGLYIFKRYYVKPKPFGVVAVISPWNYPFALAMPPVLSALLAGNCVILKPSEVTGATGLLIERLLQRVPELAPFVRVLHGDASVGAELVASKPDFIFLTGSTATGKKVLQAAADNLIPVACELGGKDAMIVLDDADIAQAAYWGVWGAFFNAGQTCMAIERVYVVERVYEEYVRRAVAETRKLKVGFSSDLKSPYYLGPITDPRQIQTIEQHLEDALAKGACILTGGKRQDMFFEPTVLVDVDHSMLVMQEETFGPIMPIMKVKSEAEAIHLANDNDYGLGVSIWSNDLRRAQWVAGQIETGTVQINDSIAHFAVPLLPFGGVKQSGYGRTHGREGLLQFTRSSAFAVGRPPISWDLATLGRKPGHYQLLSTMLHLVFGVTPRQRLEPVIEVLEKQAKPIQGRGVGAGMVAGIGVLGALASLALIGRRRHNR